MEELEYKILSTGSRGNCVIIENVMVDCGVPFKKLKDYLYDIDVLLLTHIHSDHIRESTLKNIVMMFPNIRIFGNYEIVQYYNQYPITCINEEVPFEVHGVGVENGWGETMKFTPFKCLHDVVTYGYIWECFGCSVIYATDTADLRHAPLQKYDYFFIESNHDEKKVEQLLGTQQRTFGYNAYAGAKRHMSTQKAKGFYYMNRRNKDSKLIELHQSSRFY